MSDLQSRLRDAMALLQAGKAPQAQAILGPLARTKPIEPVDWFTVGVACHMLGWLEDALVAFTEADRRRPDDAGTVNARACILGLLGRRDEALAGQLQALRLSPHDPQVLTNVGIALEDLGRTGEALEHYDAALVVAPDFAAALLNRSAARMRLARHAEALADADRLIALDPRCADAHFNRCEALLALDRHAQALVAAGRVLAIDPGRVAAMVDRGLALACLGQIGEAREAFEQARAVDPQTCRQIVARALGRSSVSPDTQEVDIPDPRAIYLVRGVARLARCDWEGRPVFLQRFEQIVRAGVQTGDPVCDPSLPFAVLGLPLADDVRIATIRAVSERVAERVAGARLPSTTPQRRERLRIGYVSPNFREHPAVLLNAPLLSNHDRSRFEVYGYALGSRDEGSAAQRLRGACDTVRELNGLDDAAAVRMIRDDRIDILVDIAGYSAGARPSLFALRPAHVNVAYMGNVETTASDWMDYRLTDAIATPPASAAAWTEKLVFLPRSFFVYDPLQPVDPVSPSRAQAGLPSAGCVFCCFNTAYKIEPVVFGLWTQILARVPGSVLWLLADGDVEGRLREQAQARGIDPARLVFAPRRPHASHLARLRLADVFLDTLDYNAHTTAVDALHAGVPVLTMPGRTMPSRCAASIVLAAGLPEMVEADHAAYVDLAVRLASDPGLLTGLRARLVRTRGESPLWDPVGFARCVERAYERMWLLRMEGRLPESFAIGREPR